MPSLNDLVLLRLKDAKFFATKLGREVEIKISDLDKLGVDRDGDHAPIIVKYDGPGSFGMYGHPSALGPVPDRANAIYIGEPIERQPYALALFFYAKQFNTCEDRDGFETPKDAATVNHRSF